MFIAHGPVRAYVLGERCNDSDKPGGPFKYPVTDEEIREMSEVVRCDGWWRRGSVCV